MSAPRIAIFAGPSLPAVARPRDQRFHWRSPAAAGDIADLRHDPPAALCLIDGLFEACPAPWHKELMLLMAAGTRVYGASSMGALRAAELDRHGMIGIGAIYRAYRDRQLTGDDEVALIHGPERLDWAPLSVPLVEVRATLIAVVRTGLLSVPQARSMRSAAAAIHFAARDWPALRARWLGEGHCDAATAEAVANAHVPLKRQDALACIDVAVRRCAEAPSPTPPAPPAPPLTSFLRRLLVERAG